MKLKSHLLIAEYMQHLIKETIGVNLNMKYLKMGAIAPDLSPLTRFQKHDVNSSIDEIKTTINDMPSYGFKELSYKLGRLSHYVSDSFCLAHNDFFLDLKKHYLYEKLILKVQDDYKMNQTKNTCYKGLSGYTGGKVDEFSLEFFEKKSSEYLKEIRSGLDASMAETVFHDFDYAIFVGSVIIISLLNEFDVLNDSYEVKLKLSI